MMNNSSNGLILEPLDWIQRVINTVKHMITIAFHNTDLRL